MYKKNSILSIGLLFSASLFAVDKGLSIVPGKSYGIVDPDDEEGLDSNTLESDLPKRSTSKGYRPLEEPTPDPVRFESCCERFTRIALGWIRVPHSVYKKKD